MNGPDLRRRLRAEMRAAAYALRHEWDPIGWGQIPDLPEDEYDSYAPRVVSLIESGADDRAIAAYLEALERDTIGASCGRDLLIVAAAIRRAVTAASNRTD